MFKDTLYKHKIWEDPNNPKLNFVMGQEYEAIGQIAAAVSFYLKAAEYGYESDPLVTYASLIKVALCAERLGGRNHTCSTALMHAISYMPTRPEAYFVLSRLYERMQKWQYSYMFSVLGLECTSSTLEPLPGYVEYEGEYCLIFQKAVSGWWVGQQEQSKKLFKYLLNNYKMADIYVNASLSNLESIGK